MFKGLAEKTREIFVKELIKVTETLNRLAGRDVKEPVRTTNRTPDSVVKEAKSVLGTPEKRIQVRGSCPARHSFPANSTGAAGFAAK